MDEIKKLIAELLKYSNSIDPACSFEETSKNMEKQDAMMLELKKLAKDHDTFLGRTVQFQMADSYALYIITEVFDKTVTLEWINYCDGWKDDRLGDKDTVPSKYAKYYIDSRDKMEECFRQQ